MGFQIEYFYRWNERIFATVQGESSGVSGDGAISDIIDVNLAPNKLLVSSPAGKIVISSVSVAEAATLVGIDTGQTIQEQLDAKQGAFTTGNFTEITSDVLTITGGTSAILGSGLSVQVKLAGAGQSGYLSSTDWTTFNNKVSGSLAAGYVLIGDGSAQAVNTASLGDIGATVVGGLVIKASSISNSHIVSNAAITRTKLATGTAYRILANNISGVISENAALTAGFVIISDANGQLTISPTTALQLTYLATATSDVQVQLSTLITGKATNALVQNPTATEDGYAITWDDSAQEWALTDPVVQGIPVAGATDQVLMKASGADYDAAWTSLLLSHISDVSASAADVNVLLGADAAGVTPTIIEYLAGTTSNIQTQLNSKLSNSLSPGAIYYGSGGGVATQLSPSTDGWVLTMVSGFPQWQVVVGTGTVTSIDVSGGSTGLTFSGGPVTTTGTITMSGTLDANNGGTGFSAYTIGDILYADSTTTLTKLGIGADGEVLTLAAGVPTWSAASATVGDADYGDITVSGTGTVFTVDANINKAWTGTHSFLDNSWTLLDNLDNTKILAFQLSGITAGNTRTLTIPDLSGTIALLGGSGNGAALTKVDDTNVTLTLGGGPTTSLLTAASLTLGWTGQLAVTRGGTGLNSTAQGDILYADASNSLVALPKSASSTRYLSNTGASNNPAWAQVDLTTGVTGILPVANGGTGVSTGAWLLASGATLTGVNNITSNTNSQINFTGTWTATAIGQSHVIFGGAFTNTSTDSDHLNGYKFSPTLIANANNQTLNGLIIQPSFTHGSFSPATVSNSLLVAGATSDASSNAVKIRNAAGNAIINFRNDGIIQLGANDDHYRIYTTSTGLSADITGKNIIMAGVGSLTNGVPRISIYESAAATASSGSLIEIGSLAQGLEFAPTSGSASFTYFSMKHRINTSGTYGGVTVGIEYFPDLAGVTGLVSYATSWRSGLHRFGLHQTTVPTVPADSFLLYGEDVVAGNTSPHFKTETGDVIKLYKYVDADFGNTVNTGDADTDDLIDKLVLALTAHGLIST